MPSDLQTESTGQCQYRRRIAFTFDEHESTNGAHVELRNRLQSEAGHVRVRLAATDVSVRFRRGALR